MADVHVLTDEYKYKKLWAYQTNNHLTLVWWADGAPLANPYYEPESPATSSQRIRLGSHSPGTAVDRKYKNRTHTENYLAKVKAGVRIPCKPYTLQLQKRYSTKIHQRQQTGTGSSIIQSVISEDGEYYAPWVLNPSGTGTSLSLFALQSKLLGKQRGNTWNAPVFLAEGRKTADMIANRAADLVWLARSLRRGKLDDFFDALRGTLSSNERRKRISNYNRDRKLVGHRDAASNLWLESRYGWLPFMSDVHDSMNTLMDLSDYEPSLIGRTRATIRQQWQVQVKTTQHGGTRRYYDLDQSMRAVWFWKPKAGLIPAKLGLLNPALVAWELVPFSFVADWFIPIGDYLEFLTLPFEVEHVDGCYGNRRRIQTLEVQGVSSSSRSGIARSEITYVNRSVMTSLPMPSLSQLKNEFEQGVKSWTRMTSAVALLQQNLRFFRK